MARPKKGERGCQEASKKWRQTMLKKYGGEEGLHKRAQEIGRVGGSVKGVAKGFALMPREKRQEAGRKGGKRSKRGHAKDDIDKVEKILEQESGRD